MSIGLLSIFDGLGRAINAVKLPLLLLIIVLANDFPKLEEHAGTLLYLVRSFVRWQAS